MLHDQHRAFLKSDVSSELLTSGEAVSVLSLGSQVLNLEN